MIRIILALLAVSCAGAHAQAPPAEDLASYRAQVDAIDAELVELLNRRAKVVLEIGARKRETGKAVRDPAREAQVHERLQARNPGPLANEALSRIWDRIMAEMRDIQR